ncbi:MAG: hypothetical protein KDD25_00725 [Bdellovibrionales bacterium]|nr:hypothetical protein [Bdellovibrionales bacterium]
MVRIALFAMLGFVLLAYQNCGPVSFVQREELSSHSDKPETVNNVCQGFSIVKNGIWILPFGQSSLPVQMEGTTSPEQGPLTWTISPGALAPIVGNDVEVNLGIGTYHVTAKTNDNLCSDSYQLVVRSGDCANPSASSITVTYPSGQLHAGVSIPFTIGNYNNLREVKVKWPDGNTQDINSSTFNHVFPNEGTFDLLFTAKDSSCSYPISKTVRISVLPEACVPEVTSVMPQVLTNPAYAELPVRFQIGAPYNKFVGDKVHVKFGDGVEQDVSANPFEHIYAKITQPQDYDLTFTAREKKCNTDISQNLRLRVAPKPCVPTVTDISVSTDPALNNIYNTDEVKFTINNAAAFSQFNWNLGNQSSGTGTNIPKTNYSVPANQDYKDYVATFSGSGMQTCGQVLTKTLNIRVNLKKFEATYVVSESEEKPPVKLFFIVDNSTTMLTEQNTLKNGFDQMFSGASLDALKQFSSDVYLFNTAQYTTVKGTDVTLDSIVRNYSISQAANLTSYTGLTTSTVVPGDSNLFTRTRQTVSSNSRFGYLPGDVMGYRNISADTQSRSFEISPVSQFYQNAGGANLRPTLFSEYLHLDPNPDTATVNQFKADFKSRVELLNPNKYATNPWGYYTQEESASCAISRILTDPRFTSSDHQLAFIIVSDEDENDTGYSRCLKSTGQISQVRGRCGVQGTRFEYSTGDYCRITYPYNYNGYYSIYSTRYSYQICVRYDDTGTTCIDYDTQSGTRRGRPGTGETCADFIGLPASSGVTCTSTESSYGFTKSFSGSIESVPSNCTENDVPASDRAYYVDGSCRLTSYAFTHRDFYLQSPNEQCSSFYPNITVGGGVTPCYPDGSRCGSDRITDFQYLDVPTNNLACSTCMSGTCPPNKTYYQHITQDLGGQDCQANPNYPVATGPEQYFDLNDPNKCPNGVFIRNFSYPIQTVQQTTYANSNNGTTRIQYNTFIKSKFDAIQAATGLRPTLTTFTYQTNPPASDQGASKGTNYMALADLLGYSALKFPINVADYSPALQQMTNFIVRSLNRVFVLNIQPGQQIRKVYWKRGAAAEVEVVAAESYILNGDKIIFNSTIKLIDNRVITVENLDRFRIQYW